MAGLLPKPVRDGYKPGERFHLNWAHMQSFKPTTLYLAQWDILENTRAARDLLIKSHGPAA